MPRRYWTGFNWTPDSGDTREAFRFDGTPCKTSHPQYAGAYGPFRTRRAAEWLTRHPFAHFDNPTQVELMARAEETPHVASQRA